MHHENQFNTDQAANSIIIIILLMCLYKINYIATLIFGHVEIKLLCVGVSMSIECMGEGGR